MHPVRQNNQFDDWGQEIIPNRKEKEIVDFSYTVYADMAHLKLLEKLESYGFEAYSISGSQPSPYITANY